MQRIMVIGGPGAGKSTLAQALGQATGLPVVHLDQHFLRPGWRPTPMLEMNALAIEAAQRPAWILDGNYADSWAFRAARADLVIFVDLPTRLRMRRLTWRTLRHYGRSRPELGPGLPERFDAEFRAYARAYGQEGRRKALELIDSCRARGYPRCVILRSPRGVRWLVKEVQSKGRIDANPSRAP